MKRTALFVLVALITTVGVAGVASADNGVENEAVFDGALSELDEQCEDVDDSVIGVTENNELFDDEVTLHAGTGLWIVVCSGGDTTEFSLDENNGYEIRDNSDNPAGTYIKVTGDKEEIHFTDTELVDKPGIDGFTILLPDTVYRGGEDSLFELELRFHGTAMATDFNTNSAEFVTYMNNIDNTIEELDQLNSETERLDQIDTGNITAYEKRLEALRDNQTKAINVSTKMEAMLYERAMTHTQTQDMNQAMEQLHDERNNINDRATDSANESLAVLTEIERDAQSTVRMNVGLGLIAGLLLGLLGGSILPWVKGKEVYDFYQVSSRNTYTSDVLRIPVGLGLIVLLIGVGLMLWFNILGVIV